MHKGVCDDILDLCRMLFSHLSLNYFDFWLTVCSVKFKETYFLLLSSYEVSLGPLLTPSRVGDTWAGAGRWRRWGWGELAETQGLCGLQSVHIKKMYLHNILDIAFLIYQYSIFWQISAEILSIWLSIASTLKQSGSYSRLIPFSAILRCGVGSAAAAWLQKTAPQPDI